MSLISSSNYSNEDDVSTRKRGELIQFLRASKCVWYAFNEGESYLYPFSMWCPTGDSTNGQASKNRFKVSPSKYKGSLCTR